MKKTLNNLHSPASRDLRRTTLFPGEVSHLSVIESQNAHRRRLKLRRLKYTCQAKNNMAILKIKESDSENKDFRGCSTKFTSEMHGLVSVIGRRSEMEDAAKVELGFLVRDGQKFDFYGVYDGHGGCHVAEACRKRLHKVVVEEAEKEGCGGGAEWAKVMIRGFEKMDEEVNNGGGGGGGGRNGTSARMMGSTALVALVGEDVVVVANSGDSRAVISRGGVAVALSNDHKPNRPDELKRIEDAGGRVINWNGHRLLGVLATSRSIGDQYLKPYVISKPEVTVSKRTENDEFLILATDGLWDALSNEVACQVVTRCLDGRMKRKSQAFVNQNRAAEAAAVLAELAMARGSKDNISVIVIELKKRGSSPCAQLS